ncbi:hypothetical protein BHE90_017438 [Fusarium euwallaceae]|uniref:Uncharacterized protein n=1 Tax=Fusarium euwallaceae TaxID=1147111 RepID=A0A430KXJ6_9HYPO|nr:hypothetical protein BHE90_017438 [Fusarium euwallaceae]
MNRSQVENEEWALSARHICAFSPVGEARAGQKRMQLLRTASHTAGKQRSAPLQGSPVQNSREYGSLYKELCPAKLAVRFGAGGSTQP